MDQPFQPLNSHSPGTGKIPDTWIVALQADGTIRLVQNVDRRAAGCIVFAFTALPTFAFIAGVYELLFDIPWLSWGDERAKPVAWAIVAAAIFSMLMLSALFWVLFGRRELRVASNVLEETRILFGYKRIKQYRNASLEFLYTDDEHPPKQGWLVAESQGDQCRIEPFHLGDPDLYREVYNLGLFLSQATGWPVKPL